MLKIVSLAFLTLALAAQAQTQTQTQNRNQARIPANAPAGATGICKDGTYSTAPAKSGACAGHKGVQTWYAAPSMPAPTPAGTVAAVPAPKAAATPTPAMPAPTPSASTSAAPSPKRGPAAAAAAKTATPGGAPGLVWLNTGSNVYHCYGTEYYGKTKAGSYMSEADAKAKGAHGVKGATCEGK